MSTPTATTSPMSTTNWRLSIASTTSNLTVTQYEPRVGDWLRIPGLTLSEEDMMDVQSLIEEFEDQLTQLASSKKPRDTFKKRAKGAFLGRYGKWLVKLIPKSHSDRIDESSTAKESLRQSIEALRSLSAPFRRLPPELLSEIFAYCLPDDPFNRPRPDTAPLLLTKVCASWRNVAISTPILWSSLAMTRVDKPACHKSTMVGIRTWLARSADRPLWVSFHADAFPYGALDEVLNSFHNRFEHIRLTTGYQSHPVIHETTTFPLLKYFDIRTPYELPAALEARFSSALATSRCLKQFTWINTTRIPRVRPMPFAVKWGTLTRLILHSPSDTRTCLSILAEASQLEYLAINNLRGGGSSLNMVTMPHLSQFIVDTMEYADIFLSNLTLPKLRDFLLNIRTWEHQSVISLIERSCCPLESINVYFADISETQIIEILRLTQHSLKEFTVQTDPQDMNARPFRDALAEALTYTDEGHVLCPNLDTLALYECIACSEGKLEKMLLSRSEKALRSNSVSGGGLKPDILGDLPMSGRRPLRLLQTYDAPDIQRSLDSLRESGLLVRLFSQENKSMDMPPADEDKLARLVAEAGLLVRLYDPSTGYFDTPEGHW